MNHVWMIADLHLDDPDALKWRPMFKSAHEMSNYLLFQINSLVASKDTLWILGDFCDPHQLYYEKKFMYWWNSIRCKNKKLVVGNHDDINKLNKYYGNSTLNGVKIFNVEHYDQKLIKNGYGRFFLNHYAMRNWQFQNENCIQCHGHSHGQLENEGLKRIDVGWDNWYKPMPVADIVHYVDNNCDDEIHQKWKQEGLDMVKNALSGIDFSAGCGTMKP